MYSCDCTLEKICNNSSDVSILAIKRIISLIFDLNVFEYKETFFRQIKGIAMGSICGPSIANIVVYKLESKWLKINRPILYKRYIGDIILIVSI
jgi:hypothetical protein